MSAKEAKKTNKTIKIKEVKIRRQWKINPKTKVVESSKKYCRRKAKKELKKQTKQEDIS